jgi:hypothetical protein
MSLHNRLEIESSYRCVDKARRVPPQSEELKIVVKWIPRRRKSRNVHDIMPGKPRCRRLRLKNSIYGLTTYRELVGNQNWRLLLI